MLSVIIPTLNEATVLPRTLAAARVCLVPGDEIIVADGGSEDATRALAERAGAQVIVGPRGRGLQMNAGAAAARGDTLLFLHADTLLPPDARTCLHSALENEKVLGGNFTLSFDAADAFSRLFARVYNARSRRQRIFYGDSTLWVRREVFHSLGGFAEARLMEDYAFCRALRAESRRCHPNLPLSVTIPLLTSTVVTSARRFAGKRGVALKMLGVWSLLHILYACGASPDRLEQRFYPPA